MFAEIALPLYVHQTYTYRVPDDLHSIAQVGCRCVINFSNRVYIGYIVALSANLSEEIPPHVIKEITTILDESPLITLEVLSLTRWIADYYYAPWGEVLKAALPAGINAAAEVVVSITAAGRSHLEAIETKKIENSTKLQALQQIADKAQLPTKELAQQYSKPRLAAITRELEKSGFIKLEHQMNTPASKAKRQNAVRLAENYETKVAEVGISSPQKRVVDYLSQLSTEPSLSELLDEVQVSTSVVRTLEKHGIIEVFARTVRRNPLAHLPQSLPHNEELSLTPPQKAALIEITAMIEQGEYATFLLHGVTGAGKTEVYLRAMRATLAVGKTALMLVPEISLTPVFSRRLCEQFGDAVAILHSSLSEGERLDEWRRVYDGAAQIVIGTRSAVFAPLQNLGLVVVDEEHESSYKQAETPRYNGRDSAIMRALKANAVVVLGSATPSMESYHNAQTGKYRYIRLAERIGQRPLAKVEVIDMRIVFKRHGKSVVFAEELLEAIKEVKARGEQSIVLLNRRGYSAFLLCRSCGVAIHCRDCDVTMTFHREANRLICHYCNFQRSVPQFCPSCNGPYIFYVGEGTEQLESMIQTLFPDYKIARLDRDTTRRKGSFEKIINDFAAGEIDILIGTQMIAKGHDFPNVTLVGVISIDAGLGMPDFRAAERTFQLLTQVAGRAGRGDAPGRVILQTYHPDHYSVRHAQSQDYLAFYQHEIGFRRMLYYPPFNVLVNIIIRHKDLTRAQATAAELAQQLRAAIGTDKQTRVLGPASAPLARIKAEHRMQLLIKARTRVRAREILDIAMNNLAHSQDTSSISIEVDPIDLM